MRSSISSRSDAASDGKTFAVNSPRVDPTPPKICASVGTASAPPCRSFMSWTARSTAPRVVAVEE